MIKMDRKENEDIVNRETQDFKAYLQYSNKIGI